MKLMPFKEALLAGKEKINEVMLIPRVKKAKKKAELEMLNIEEELATVQVELHEETCKEDVDFKRIITLLDKIGILERRMKQYEDILAQMFPGEQ